MEERKNEIKKSVKMNGAIVRKKEEMEITIEGKHCMRSTRNKKERNIKTNR